MICPNVLNHIFKLQELRYKTFGKEQFEYQQRVKSLAGLILKSSFFEIVSRRSMQMLRQCMPRSSSKQFLGGFHTSSLELSIFPLIVRTHPLLPFSLCRACN